MKKQVLTTLLAVLMISILPGCGKSKNKGDAPGGIIHQPGIVDPNIGGVGGCYDTRHLQNSGITLGFHGTLQQSVGGLKAHLQFNQAASGFPGGYTDIAVSGNHAYAQVTLSATAVGHINYYGGQVCGFYVDAYVLNPAQNGPAWSGNIGGGTIGVVVQYYGGYGVLQL